MACSNPLPNLYDSRRMYGYSDYIYRQFDFIPCGRCINCRIDKINQMTDRCEYELIKRGCGAFVTFTYDDIHIQHLLRRDSQGKLVATLSRDDSRRFLYRLNKNVKKFLRECGYKTMPMCQKDFMYILAGEYGDHGSIFDRPHFHALFFGLDYAFCKKIFARSWRGQGSIKVLPITNGAPQYLLDYITSLEFGEQRKIKYDFNNLEAPFQVHSLGLGVGLYYDQLDFIKKHDNQYRWHGKDRPLPQYYKNKFLLPSVSKAKTFRKTFDKAKLEGAIKYKKFNPFDFQLLTDLQNYRNLQADVKEHAATKRIKRPIADLSYLYEQVFEFKQNHDDWFRLCYPTPMDLGYTQEECYNYYKDLPYQSIQDLVCQADLSQVPF